MPQTRFDEALTDVSKIFERPEDILGAADLSEAQKIASSSNGTPICAS